ncbi:MAG: phosphoribosylformylglycinamidine synthase subunit PurS [Candidatus Binatia bacterium]|nr:MAG: phosphoribosylformylglycinamidine synthase subunit PurS [Candidatus Binatia bacterium]
MRVRVYVMPREDILDPQGKAVEESLHSLGFTEVRSARLGKRIDLELEETDEERARSRVDEMCRKLLANEVIEDYSFEIV